MRTLWQDARFGLRMLWKTPGFTAVAVLALALGIGANTTIFSVINALLLHPFSFRDMDHLAMIWESRTQAPDERDGVAFANFLDVRDQKSSFVDVAATMGWAANLTEGDMAERLEGVAVSPQFFSVLGVQPAQGRAFTPEEERPDRDAVVIISDGLWRRRFGGDASVVGRNIRVNDRQFTVVGIMPPGFEFRNGNIEVWTPLFAFKENTTNRASHNLLMLARLQPGATVASAQSELNSLAQHLAEQYPATNAQRTFLVESLLDSAARGPRPYSLIMLGAVLFVLLIACANVANLQLMRAASRQKEIAVRLALGASRWRLVQQLLTESVLLALAGGLLGLLLSTWAIDALRTGIPANFANHVSGWNKLGIDWRVFAFTLLVSISTGLAFGLAPALLATRANLNESLKEGGRTASDSSGGKRARSLLVIAEVALSLVLLVGAGLMIRSFLRLLDVNPGFNGENVLTMELSLPYRKYAKSEQKSDFFARLVRRVEALPGVTSAGAINLVPLDMSDDSAYFSIEGRAPDAPGEAPLADYRTITPGYFDALKIPFLKGRNFTDRDVKSGACVSIIDERMARRFFADEEPLGQRVRLGDSACEIVGIVGNVRYKSYIDEARDERLRPAIYLPHAQAAYGEMTLVARSAIEPASLTAAVQKEVQAIDKDQPIFNVRTMALVAAESMAPQRLSAFMFAGFALIALLLAAVGIYAVVSYSVVQRTHEIGVRMALGAQAADIFKLIIGQGVALIGVGVCLGLIGAIFVTRVMASILYGVSATDFVTFTGISTLLVAIALFACYIPARRATKVDPMVALRYE